MLTPFSDVDDCASSPCHNEGQCVDGINQYTCKCIAGWTGVVCEIGKLLNHEKHFIHLMAICQFCNKFDMVMIYQHKLTF